MLRIDEVHGKNFCQHEQIVVDFGDANVIGVFGPNGVGKSNFCEIFRFAITGESANAGPKAENLRKGAESGFGAVKFRINDRRCEIKRHITKATCSLKYGPDKDDKVTKAKDVNAKVRELLGTEFNILHNYVFIKQGMIDRILFDQPAKRKEELQRLFGMASAEKVRDLLQRELATVQVASHQPRIEELVSQITELSKARAATEQEYNRTKSLVLSEEEVAELRTKIEAYNASRESVGELKAIQDKLIALYTDRDSTSAELERAKQELEGRKQGLAQQEAKRTELQALLDQGEAIQKAKSDYQGFIGETKTLADAMAALNRPTGDPESWKREIEKLTALVAATDAQVKACHKWIMEFRTGKCPTCGTEIQNANELIHRYESYIATAEPALECSRDARDRMDRQLREYDSANSMWQLETARLSDKARVLHQQMEELESLANQPLDQAKMKGVRDDLVNMTKSAADLAELEGYIRATEQSFKDIQESVQATLDTKEGLSKSSADAPDGAFYKTASSKLESHDTHYREFMEAKSQYDLAVERERSATEEKARLEAEEAKGEKLRKWRTLLDDARAILHKDNLPAMVSARYMETLCINLGKFLRVFEVPFTVDIDSDLNFVCTFVDEKEIPADRLSGGEKMMLAVCFRFAVNDLFANNLGLLVLDEPTAYLDDDNIGHVAKLLEKVRDYTARSGMQIIVVTHEPRLIPVMDKVIRFSA